MKIKPDNHREHPARFSAQPLSAEDRLIRQIRFCGRFLHHNTEQRGSQRHVLERLKAHGTMTQKDLMESMRIQSGSASELLGKIEQAGLVSRVKCETDRRLVEIRITDEGLQELDKMQAQYRQSVSELLTVLNDDEKTQLTDLLDKLAANWAERLDRLPDRRRPGGRGRHRRQHPASGEGRSEHA